MILFKITRSSGHRTTIYQYLLYIFPITVLMKYWILFCVIISTNFFVGTMLAGMSANCCGDRPVHRSSIFQRRADLSPAFLATSPGDNFHCVNRLYIAKIEFDSRVTNFCPFHPGCSNWNAKDTLSKYG